MMKIYQKRSAASALKGQLQRIVLFSKFYWLRKCLVSQLNLQRKRQHQQIGKIFVISSEFERNIMGINQICSIKYGGITISSTNTTNIKVPSAKRPNHKKTQNVSETLRKLKQMQTSNLVISKTIVQGPKAVRKCKTEPKFYHDEVNDEDDNGDNGEMINADDEHDDPNYDGGTISDDSASGDDNNDDDDEDYKPYAKKSKVANKIPTPQTSQKMTESNPKFKSIKVNAPPVFLCMKCKNKFQTLADLKQHVFQTNSCSIEALICKKCDKKFDTRKRLSQHMKTHEEKAKFICDKCGKIYQNQYNLENHKSSQHGEYLEENQSVYKCRLCSEKFTNRTDLFTHMKNHPAMEPQQLLCDTCGKCFKSSHNLKSHIKIHLDIRPFGCTLCPKRFRTRLVLKQHMHVHTGIKEFLCNICAASFAKNDSLRLHLKKRHGGATNPSPVAQAPPIVPDAQSSYPDKTEDNVTPDQSCPNLV